MSIAIVDAKRKPAGKAAAVPDPDALIQERIRECAPLQQARNRLHDIRIRRDEAQQRLTEATAKKDEVNPEELEKVLAGADVNLASEIPELQRKLQVLNLAVQQAQRLADEHQKTLARAICEELAPDHRKAAESFVAAAEECRKTFDRMESLAKCLQRYNLLMSNSFPCYVRFQDIRPGLQFAAEEFSQFLNRSADE